jgi:pimeloyl-CoA synthetase
MFHKKEKKNIMSARVFYIDAHGTEEYIHTMNRKYMLIQFADKATIISQSA